MTRPADGKPSRRNRLQAALRGFGMVSSVALGAFAVWLIVTAETQKGTRVGALIGFWALLIAAFAVFGTRHPLPALATAADQPSRPSGELARVEDAAARREYEYRLMEMLRREITATMSSELVTLRADVAALRSELVEKVGGQIRLERIETTRVIGSDIEALQHEVRQMMMGGRQLGELGSFSLGSTHTTLVAPEPSASEPLRPEPARPLPAPPARPQPPSPLPPEPIAPEPLVPEPIAPEPLVPEPIAPEPSKPARPTPAPPTPAPPMSEPAKSEPAKSEPAQSEPPTRAEPDVSGDPFASMPRLSPFTDFEVDAVESRSDAEESYDGRRRHDGPASPVGSEPAEADSGRHTNANGESPARAKPGSGGRRRRAVDGEDDVLARILSREASR